MRGVLRASASLSPRSKMLSTYSFCSGSMSPLSVLSSMSSLISSSVYTSCSLATSWPSIFMTPFVMLLNNHMTGYVMR